MDLRGLSWNVRGIASDKSLNMLQQFILEHKLHFLFIADPMISFFEAHALLFQNLNFSWCCVLLIFLLSSLW